MLFTLFLGTIRSSFSRNSVSDRFRLKSVSSNMCSYILSFTLIVIIISLQFGSIAHAGGGILGNIAREDGGSGAVVRLLDYTHYFCLF